MKYFDYLLYLLSLCLLVFCVLFVVFNSPTNCWCGSSEQVAETFVDNSLDTPLLLYKVDMGDYPSTEEGILALAEKPSKKGENWRGPYIKSVPEDPWGNDYVYRYPGFYNHGSYDLSSLGPDGIFSGDDLANWD